MIEGKRFRLAVADFAGKLFGTIIAESDVVEETLVPVSTYGKPLMPEDLRKSIDSPLPENGTDLLGT